MQHIKLVFESFCRALIRFFDNRAVKNNDIEYYRMELDKRSRETQKLIDSFLLPKVVTPEVEDEVDYQPINKGKFKSWETKRRELETQSRLEAMRLKREAETALNKKKTNEQLEEELGIVNG